MSSYNSCVLLALITSFLASGRTASLVVAAGLGALAASLRFWSLPPPAPRFLHVAAAAG